MAAELRQVGQAVRLGQRSLAALAVVVAVAVLREGVGGRAVPVRHRRRRRTPAPLSLAAGGVAGLALACAVSWLLYRGLVTIPLHRLFSVTNALIALLAAGMAGQAAAMLHAADLLPGWGEQLWNTSAILADDSFVGRSLHALIGYSARPSGIQLAAWLGTLLLLAVVLPRRRAGRGARRVAAAVLLAALVAGGPAGPRRRSAHPGVPQAPLRAGPHRGAGACEIPAAWCRTPTTPPTSSRVSTSTARSWWRRARPSPCSSARCEPGEYHFFGDFHQDTAQGVLVAK